MRKYYVVAGREPNFQRYYGGTCCSDRAWPGLRSPSEGPGARSVAVCYCVTIPNVLLLYVSYKMMGKEYNNF